MYNKAQSFPFVHRALTLLLIKESLYFIFKRKKDEYWGCIKKKLTDKKVFQFSPGTFLLHLRDT